MSQEILDEMIEMQKRKLFALGRLVVPTLTEEDLLQPMDYPQLEMNPHFRHEEGVLEGLLSARAALRAVD